jgi:dipeptidyl aminopeptidase/acylaminoacyl peptidase
MRRPGILLFLICTLIFTGCSIQISDSDVGKALPDPPVETDAVFGYERRPIEATPVLREAGKNYDIFTVAFPAYFDDPENPTVTCWYYKQRDATPKANILQLPILGGDYAPSRFFSEYFAENGFNVLFFERKSTIFDTKRGLEQTRKILQSSVVDVRRGLDWLLAQPDVDPDKIGIFGISMGGLLGSLTMAADSRIHAGVFALNGGNLPELLAVSEEGEVKEFYEAILKDNGWDKRAFIENATREISDVDPLTYAPNLDPTRVLHISPYFDKVVPYELAEQWYNAAHQPRRITIPTGHYSSVVAINFIKRNSKKHFEKCFGLK